MPELLIMYSTSVGSRAPLAIIVIALFLASYYHLFRWRDFYTALEIALVAWLVAGITASLVAFDLYRILFHDIGSVIVIKTDWVIAIVRFAAVQMVLLVPAFLSVPLVWFYLNNCRRQRLRFNKWLMLTMSVAFLDLWLNILVFIPLWMFFIRITG